MAIALPTMRWLGAAIAMASAIAMVPQGGLATKKLQWLLRQQWLLQRPATRQGQRRGNEEDALVLEAEAASTLKLKNGNYDGVVVDGSSLEDIVTGNGAGTMDGNSPIVGMSDDDNDDDVHHRHL
jgi:hypothetical protein